jgi:hypothetical protein
MTVKENNITWNFLKYGMKSVDMISVSLANDRQVDLSITSTGRGL